MTDGLRIGSLFSGMGGLDMAVESVFPGARPVWFCEFDDGPSKILARHWPDVPNLRDVTTIDWSEVPPIDVLTGGYPCQPFSAAGRRKGADDERHLWPYVREAVRVLRPRFVLLENVAGHRSLGFDRVLGDLAEDGVDVRWTSVRASDVGAPHHRERLFILAVPAGEDVGNSDGVGTTGGRVVGPSGSAPAASTTDLGDAADSDRGGRGPGAEQSVSGAAEVSPVVGGGALAANSDGEGGQDFGHGSGVVPELSGAGGCDGSLPDTADDGRERGGPARDGRAGSADGCNRDVEWGAYAPAVRRWERVTRPAPSPTDPNLNGRPRLNAAFAEWMMGLPAGHVTGTGIPRTAQLKAIGNGVCPQQGAAALRLLLDMDVPEVTS